MQASLRKQLHAASGPIRLEVDLLVQEGHFLALTGPSGGGKTTLLRLLAGLMRPDAGRIEFGGRVWLDTDAGLFIRPQHREVGMVFQDYALFPNMRVRENLAYGLGKGASASIVDELIDVMELQELVHRFPTRLSGGQQQRVALARALVRRPKLLLLDEPLSALDPALRSRLQDYLLQLHRRYALTTLLVTHDPAEMLKLADEVLVLENGQVSRSGPTRDILEGYLPTNQLKLVGVVESLRREGAYLQLVLRVGEEAVPVRLLAGSLPEVAVGDQLELDWTTTWPLDARLRKGQHDPSEGR